MALIRLDSTDCFRDPAPLEPDEFEAALEEGVRWRDGCIERDDWTREQLEQFGDEPREEISAGLSTTTGLRLIPEKLLRGYEKYREQSLLGSVFEIANGMHDELDAIVVFGTPLGSQCVRALQHACCDPYHNEQDRATRGSKPRIYFAHDKLDNDAAQSLIWRMQRGGYGELDAERNWMLIALDTSMRDSPVFAQLLRAKPIDCVALVEDGHWLNPIARQIAPSAPAPNKDYSTAVNGTGLVDWKWPLTPFNLLPAAFLGLDVIQLLVGAYEVAENFRTAPPRENLAIQFFALEQIARKEHRRIAWCVFDEALMTFADWMENHPRRVVARRHNEATKSKMASMYHQLVVEKPRTDLLDGIENHRTQAVQALDEGWRYSGIVTTRWLLPQIDTHTMGQLFQLMMLAP
ncbi:MAG: hypothetical protein AAFU85_28150 [Planctomycetota bacterium]